MAADQENQANAIPHSYYSPEPQQPRAAAPPPDSKYTAPAQPYAAYPGAYGPAYQPYQPYGHMPVQNGFQEPVYKNWEITKLALHGMSVAFGIIAMSLSLSLLSVEMGYAWAATSVPVGVACIVWSLAELITRWARKWQRGIPPGAHVALSLLIWLAAAFVSGMEITYLLWADEEAEYYSRSSGYRKSRYSRYPEYDFDGRLSVAKAATAFTVLLWLVHFILFVGACVDTSRRNSARRHVMYVSAPPVWGGPQASGWQPVPQQAQPTANIPMQTRAESNAAADSTDNRQSSFVVSPVHESSGHSGDNNASKNA